MQQKLVLLLFGVSYGGLGFFFSPMKYPLRALPNFLPHSKLTNFVTNTLVPFSLQTISHDQKFRFLFLLFILLILISLQAGNRNKQNKTNPQKH